MHTTYLWGGAVKSVIRVGIYTCSTHLDGPYSCKGCQGQTWENASPLRTTTYKFDWFAQTDRDVHFQHFKIIKIKSLDILQAIAMNILVLLFFAFFLPLLALLGM
jgi:hypothetical protein